MNRWFAPAPGHARANTRIVQRLHQGNGLRILRLALSYSASASKELCILVDSVGKYNTQHCVVKSNVR
uniref:Uncharacterized protein n=1 Tax=Timema cristinae TaxID=61476 RepID=A0A7R9D4B8_TIMCR|nr:unnamed protein product [Timema cristinae]